MFFYNDGEEFADLSVPTMLGSGNYRDAAASITANNTTSNYRSTFIVPILHNTTASPAL
jgi:hypothetical protein